MSGSDHRDRELIDVTIVIDAARIDRDTYKLVLEIFVSTKSFPKEYKYSLGRDMEL